MGLFRSLFGGGRANDRPHPTAVMLAGRSHNFEIKGEAHYQSNLSKLAGGRSDDGARVACFAVLIHEDGNRFDENAVRVDIGGKTVGYLSAGDAPEYRARMAELGLAGKPAQCSAVIVGGWDRGRGDRGSFGVKLGMKWPCELPPEPKPKR